MKKIALTLMAAVVALTVFAQSDKMVKHNGEKLDVKIVKVAETIITFKYPGEEAEQSIGRFAVAQIVYGGSGRKETISEKIVVAGEEDWEKVQIITDPAQVVGLKKGEDVRGKTSGWTGLHTAGTADKKASKKIKEAAAKMGAPFVLMTSDKSDGFGVKQSIKNGVVYNY